MSIIHEKRLSVEFLYVAVFTTVTIMLWVGLEVVRSLTQSAAIPQVPKEELTPLSAELQLETVSRLKTRTQIPQEVLDAVEVQGISAIIPVTGATESARIDVASQGEEATRSGGI